MSALCSPMFAVAPHCNGGSHALQRRARGKCIQTMANRIAMVVSRWLWVVAVRRCARGKCLQTVANRIAMGSSCAAPC